MTMPNFLVIGAQKAGTTSLYYYLKQHPRIYMSPVKEPHFFSFEGSKSTDLVTDIDAYRNLFRGASSETAIGEASPSYIYYPGALERIRRHVPEARLVAVLRDPAERAYSNFLYGVWLGREPLDDFSRALREEEKRIRDNWEAFWHYKQKGFYYEQLRRFFDTFGGDQIRVHLYEDLRERPIDVMREIFAFLDVDDTFVPDVSVKHNVSGVPKNGISRALVAGINLLTPVSKRLLPRRMRQVRDSVRSRLATAPPQLPPEVRRELVEEYREDILKLQDLIDRDLSRWLR